MSWSIREFLSKSENAFFVEIAREWITDRFNLTGLEENVPSELWTKYEPHYYRGMRMLAGLKDHQYTAEEKESGEFFYGLLHKRYVLTNGGIEKLLKSYEKGLYGSCPKMTCDQQMCLPIGESDVPNEKNVRIYCPRCRDLIISDSTLDGAFFGPNLPHMFFMVKPHKRPTARLFTPPRDFYHVGDDDRLRAAASAPTIN